MTNSFSQTFKYKRATNTDWPTSQSFRNWPPRSHSLAIFEFRIYGVRQGHIQTNMQQSKKHNVCTTATVYENIGL